MLNFLKITFRIGLYLGLAYFTYLMVLITLQYVPLNNDVSFLVLKDELVHEKHYQIAFFSHVYTSIFVLILGIPQFISWVRQKLPSWHKNLGKIYISIVLFVAAPSGFIMAIYANGNSFTKFSFILQSILWFAFTLYAFRLVRTKNWKKHEHFMIRSYALTLSAISLRLFKWIIVGIWELPPMDTYKIVAWLGWIVNLIIAEFYIYLKRKNSTTPA